MHVCSVLQDVV